MQETVPPVGDDDAADPGPEAPIRSASAVSAASPTEPELHRGLVVAVAVAGLALRMIILATPLGRPDADEVLSGLMARHVGTGTFPWFVWGQHYGGTIELLPVALSMRLFGDSALAMRLPTVVLGAVNCVVLWRVAARVLSPRRAQVAALLMWLGPAAAVWLGVREQLFYPPTVLLGLLVVLFALRTRETTGVADYAGLGLVLGVGVWTSPNVVYFALPAAVIVLHPLDWRRRSRELVRGGAAVALTAAVGALPWLVDNATNSFAALRSGGAFPVIGTYPGRWLYFFTDGLPALLGFRELFTYRWLAGPIGVAAYLGVLGLLLWAAAIAVRRVAWDGLGFVVFPFVFASIPWVMDDPNGRYLFYVVPFVAVLLARVVGGRRTAALALALTLAVTGLGLQRIYAVSELESTGFRVGNVGDLGSVIAVLDRERIGAVYGDYWVAYRLDFETAERIVAAPAWGVERYEPYTRRVQGSARVAWVVSVGPQADALRAALAELGVAAIEHPAGEFVVVVPDRPVAPAELPAAARHAP